MKLIKMLGLSGLIALLAMAFVGAGTASADSACLVDPKDGGAQGECPAGFIYEEDIIGLSSNAVFTMGDLETKCKSKFLADYVENEGPETGLVYLILTLTFSDCQGACDIEEAENLPYYLLVLMSPLEHAILTEDDEGEPSFLLENCELFPPLPVYFDCLYQPTKKEVLLDYILELNKEEKPLVGALRAFPDLLWKDDDEECPKEANFEATYLIYEEDFTKEKDSYELFFTALP